MLYYGQIFTAALCSIINYQKRSRDVTEIDKLKILIVKHYYFASPGSRELAAKNCEPTPGEPGHGQEKTAKPLPSFGSFSREPTPSSRLFFQKKGAEPLS